MSYVINRQQIEIVELLLPEHWAVALLYGDTSGLEDSELIELENWIAQNSHLTCVNVEDGSAFYRYHDVDQYVLPTNCCTYTFHLL